MFGATTMGVVIIAQAAQLSSSLSLRKAYSPTPSSYTIHFPFHSRRSLNPHFNPLPLRLNKLTSRCSNVNTEVIDRFTIDENLQEDLTTVDSNPSIPIVHLTSDILETTETLNLLTEVTYVDTLLTTLPVLSEEEQNIIAATPAHPAGLYALYASSLAGNLVEQLWNFAWPASIALLHSSLLPIAVIGFFTKIAVILGGPLVGKLMDYFPRVLTCNCLNIIQAVAQLLSVGMIIHAHSIKSSSISSILFQPWFFILVLAGAIERLSGLALGVAVERDWVVLLAGTNRPIALAQANAILSRINLLCEIAGASLFGILLSKYDTVKCLKFAAKFMIYSLPILVVLTWLTNKLASGVLDRAKSLQTCSRYSYGNIVETIKDGWIEYLQQPVLPASLAYVLLYFNVVLAPSSLMTAFLTQHGLNPSIIGGFSGLCAFMGVAATFVSANMVKRLGILKAGAAGLILQALFLTIAVGVYWTGSLSQQIPLLFFLSLIALSRLGHMSYEVLGAQILQTGIPPSKANLIGTTEISVASLAECVMLGIAIIANDVSHFGFLAMLSLLSVLGAACLFCRWLANPTEMQRSLFPFDRQL